LKITIIKEKKKKKEGGVKERSIGGKGGLIKREALQGKKRPINKGRRNRKKKHKGRKMNQIGREEFKTGRKSQEGGWI